MPHGAIQLDAAGTILRFNRYEAELSQLPQQAQLGKNFFTDVAPCTRVRQFHGAFLQGMAARHLDESFQFHFPFAHGPRDVTVRLYYSARSNTVWVIVWDAEDVPPPA